MRPSIRLLVAALTLPAAAPAQSLDLMINNTGLSIGDSRIVRGIRLNYRDDRMERVTGINATIWSPYQPARGYVKGLALGLPVTGARRIDGLGIGVLGVGADSDFNGLGLGLFGVGAGRNLSGITVGGFGAGAGGNITGITIGGFGAGAGGNVKGLTIGGFGAGAGGNITGIQMGLFGVGAGGNVTGFSFGGFGAGAGGDVKGVTIGGFGAGAGGDITGLTIGGFGAGAGGTLRGLALGLVGVGAPRVRGIAVALSSGGHDVVGGAIAPVYFKVASSRNRRRNDPPIERDEYGYVRGITVSSWNRIQGEQHGLSIGLLNTAWELNGWQIGVLNYARNNPKGLRLLPIFNRAW